MGLGENLKERNESQVCRQSIVNSKGCSGSVSGAEEGCGMRQNQGIEGALWG